MILAAFSKHPHPRIEYGAGSSPLPRRERGYGPLNSTIIFKWARNGDGQPQGLPLRQVRLGLFSYQSPMSVATDTTNHENVGAIRESPLREIGRGLFSEENGLVPGTGNHKGCPYNRFAGACFRSNRSCRLSPTPPIMKMAVGEIGRGLFSEEWQLMLLSSPAPGQRPGMDSCLRRNDGVGVRRAIFRVMTVPELLSRQCRPPLPFAGEGWGEGKCLPLSARRGEV